jgi:hypothetical protein
MVELLTPNSTPETAGPAPAEPAPCTAETAECTCPEFCERDHGNE